MVIVCYYLIEQCIFVRTDACWNKKNKHPNYFQWCMPVAFELPSWAKIVWIILHKKRDNHRLKEQHDQPRCHHTVNLLFLQFFQTPAAGKIKSREWSVLCRAYNNLLYMQLSEGHICFQQSTVIPTFVWDNQIITAFFTHVSDANSITDYVTHLLSPSHRYIMLKYMTTYLFPLLLPWTYLYNIIYIS